MPPWYSPTWRTLELVQRGAADSSPTARQLRPNAAEIERRPQPRPANHGASPSLDALTCVRRGDFEGNLVQSKLVNGDVHRHNRRGIMNEHATPRLRDRYRAGC